MSARSVTPARTCVHCDWEYYFQVAIRTAPYLAVRLREPRLLEAVVKHVAVLWGLCVERSGPRPPSLASFFLEYCKDVEADASTPLVQALGHDWEYRRVWTNHALILRGELDQIRRQPRAA